MGRFDFDDAIRKSLKVMRLCSSDSQCHEQAKLGVSGCKVLIREVMKERRWK